MQESEILWCNRAVFREINYYIANSFVFEIAVSYVCQNVVYSGVIRIAVTRIRIHRQLRIVG